LAGHDLQAADTLKGLLINNTFVQQLGFKTPAQAIGNNLDYNDNGKMKIVGVVTDFHERSLHEFIKPLVILTAPGQYLNGTFHIALKPLTNGGDWKMAITGIEQAWKEIYPNDDFDYYFFDDSIAKFYETEQHTAILLNWATGLSILISCLGLLGLAIYTINQRTKEIGVRKVLGASVIVTPIAWYAMNKWMESFADRTSISWWIFAISGIGMLVAAVFTSSFQTVKAAIANPVKSLRSE